MKCQIKEFKILLIIFFAKYDVLKSGKYLLIVIQVVSAVEADIQNSLTDYEVCKNNKAELSTNNPL